MRSRSSRSAGITYLDKGARLSALREAARRAQARDGTISRILLFGSHASGVPTVRSDADLLVIVRASPHADPRGRIPDMLGLFSPVPCPLDLFVLTEPEFARARDIGAPIVREALAHGIDLLETSK